MKQQKIDKKEVYWTEDGKNLSKIVQSPDGASIYDLTEKIKDLQYVLFMYSFGPDHADVFLEGNQVTVRVKDGVPLNKTPFAGDGPELDIEVNISDEAIAEMEGDDKQSAKLQVAKLVREILSEAKAARTEHPERWARDLEIDITRAV